MPPRPPWVARSGEGLGSGAAPPLSAAPGSQARLRRRRRSTTRCRSSAWAAQRRVRAPPPPLRLAEPVSGEIQHAPQGRARADRIRESGHTLLRP
eukprot:9166262-Alexandrium_andersonii.AAC.2